jgi:hypothetical protein
MAGALTSETRRLLSSAAVSAVATIFGWAPPPPEVAARRPWAYACLAPIAMDAMAWTPYA